MADFGQRLNSVRTSTLREHYFPIILDAQWKTLNVTFFLIWFIAVKIKPIFDLEVVIAPRNLQRKVESVETWLAEESELTHTMMWVNVCGEIMHNFLLWNIGTAPPTRLYFSTWSNKGRKWVCSRGCYSNIQMWFISHGVSPRIHLLL